MLKKVLKFLMIATMVLLLAVSTYADENDGLMTAEQIERDQMFVKQFLNPFFLNALYSESDFKYDEMAVIHFDKQNDKLIIGHSAVEYMYVYGKDYIDSYGYDVVAMGSSNDKDILDWLKAIKKKYKVIVIWGSANDVANVVYTKNMFSDEYFGLLNNMITEAKNKLDTLEPSKVVYIDVKHMTPNKYIVKKEDCELYNAVADIVNGFIGLLGVEKVDINSINEKSEGGWYIHFVKKETFKKIFEKIEEKASE